MQDEERSAWNKFNAERRAAYRAARDARDNDDMPAFEAALAACDALRSPDGARKGFWSLASGSFRAMYGDPTALREPGSRCFTISTAIATWTSAIPTPSRPR
jgi:hypothetical protein